MLRILLEIQFDLGGLKAWPSALMVQPFYNDKKCFKNWKFREKSGS